MLLAFPRVRLNLRGDRAFAVAAPKLWNALPLSVRMAPTLSAFKTSLKTHLYSLIKFESCVFFVCCVVCNVQHHVQYLIFVCFMILYVQHFGQILLFLNVL